MQLYSEFTQTALRPSVATIGFFDGVHRGHRYLIEQVRGAAAQRGLASSVVTFPVHPRQVMQPDARMELLTTADEKRTLLEATGLDYCLMLDFTPQLARLSARQFMALLKERYHIEALVVGYDHRFGHNRSEGFDDYVRHGRDLGMEVILAEVYTSADGASVSSSLIRRLLLGGETFQATRYLGYEYFLDGIVVGGYRVGRKIGFPTANLGVTDADKLVPAIGVYAVHVYLKGVEYDGMLSIGYRPTLNNGKDLSIEVNIFRFNADIYDHPMRISFAHYMRPELKFDSVDQLIAQLHKDEVEAKALLTKG